MTLYLDASVLVSLFVEDAGTARARKGIADAALIVSDFASAEFFSAIGRRMRNKEIPPAAARDILAVYDAWTAKAAMRIALDASDGLAAAALVRRFEHGLRAPDALHIAIAQRLRATLFTLDAGMAKAASALGAPIVS